MTVYWLGGFLWIAGVVTGMVWFISKSWKWAALVLLGILTWGFWRPALVYAVFQYKGTRTLQEIAERPEFPESIHFWTRYDYYNRDGLHFDYDNRRKFIGKYLDGVHLKAVAMYDRDEEKVYLYRADESVWREYREALAEAAAAAAKSAEFLKRTDKNFAEYQEICRTEGKLACQRYRDEHFGKPSDSGDPQEAVRAARERALDAIMEQLEMFDSPEQVPPLRYRVRMAREEEWWRKKGLYKTDVVIIENNESGKRIAWSRRYRAFAWWLPERVHGIFDTAGPGEQDIDRFIRKVLLSYAPQPREIAPGRLAQP